MAQIVKNLPAMQETQVRFLGWEDPLEKEMATHSVTLAWRIPVDRGAWQAVIHGIARVRHDLSSLPPKLPISLMSSTNLVFIANLSSLSICNSLKTCLPRFFLFISSTTIFPLLHSDLIFKYKALSGIQACHCVLLLFFSTQVQSNVTQPSS